MTIQELPAEFMDLLNGVTEKRARTVIDHILAHGHVTTEDRAPCAERDMQIDHRIPFEIVGEPRKFRRRG